MGDILGLEDAIERIRTNTTKHLSLNDQHVPDDVINRLAPVIAANTSLEVLNFSSTGLTSERLEPIANALEKHPALQDLILCHNKLDDSGATMVAKLMEANPRIDVDLRDNEIEGMGALAIMRAAQSSGRTDISFNQNLIDDKGAILLAPELEKNPSLATLRLANTNIGNMGARAIAEALEENHILEQLDLSYNPIGTSGIEDLTAALKKNSTLNTLGLVGCELTDTHATMLADMLRTNTSLTELPLADSHITEKGWAALTEALKHNKNLGRMDSDRPEIEAMLEKNRTQAQELFGKIMQNPVFHKNDYIEIKERLPIIVSVAPAEAIEDFTRKLVGVRNKAKSFGVAIEIPRSLSDLQTQHGQGQSASGQISL